METPDNLNTYTVNFSTEEAFNNFRTQLKDGWMDYWISQTWPTPKWSIYVGPCMRHSLK